MGRTVGVTLERNGGHGDHRAFGESFLERVVPYPRRWGTITR
jgi:hypothetical protein